MTGFLNFTLLAVLTMFAIAAASALCWVLLGIAFQLIEPATARRVAHRTELAHGAARLARAFSTNR